MDFLSKIWNDVDALDRFAGYPGAFPGSLPVLSRPTILLDDKGPQVNFLQTSIESALGAEFTNLTQHDDG